MGQRGVKNSAGPSHRMWENSSIYFIGNPVSYKSENDITELTKALEVAGADEVDGDNGLDLSIYGLAYEYIYVKENEAYLCDKNISAENTFMVRDDSIEENELFGEYSIFFHMGTFVTVQ